MTIKKIIIFGIIMLSMMACLAGCSSVDYGTITEKSFIHAHKTYNPIIIYIAKFPRIISRWVSHPDKWQILVKNEEDSEWWTVTEEIFNNVNVGDYVDRRNTSCDEVQIREE